MGVLIDTCVLIAAERGSLELAPYVQARADEEMYLSVITVSELLHGVHRAPDPARRARRSAWVEAVIQQFSPLEIDSEVARSHALLWAELRASGRQVGAHDLLIAAQAITHGLVLVTCDLKGFSAVPGLVLEEWTTLP